MKVYNVFKKFKYFLLLIVNYFFNNKYRLKIVNALLFLIFYYSLYKFLFKNFINMYLFHNHFQKKNYNNRDKIIIKSNNTV